MDAIEAARAVVEEQHADARAAFLGGSVATDRRTATSDLDIVVLLHGAPAPYRAGLQYADWPVEMFVHTEATWHAYVERELRKRRSPLLWMCADGLLLFDTDGLGARLAAQARKLTAAGPPPVSVEEIDDRRYAITDLLDDLAGSDDQSERLFIATELVRRTGELALAISGSWSGGGKWLARRLETTAPGLSTRLHHGLQEVLGGRVKPLVAVVDEVLGQAGGRLWVGYKRAGAPGTISPAEVRSGVRAAVRERRLSGREGRVKVRLHRLEHPIRYVARHLAMSHPRKIGQFVGGCDMRRAAQYLTCDVRHQPTCFWVDTLTEPLHNRHGQACLLSRLTGGSVFACLTRFYLAGRELPAERTLANTATHHQYTSLVNDDGCGYLRLLLRRLPQRPYLQVQIT